jgi:hypothetical protein
MINSVNMSQDRTRCPYCGGAKELNRFACQPCWRKVPRELKDAIAVARENAVRWLDEHVARQASGHTP